MSILTKGIYPYLVLLLAVVLFYGNTLASGFVHDDVWQVQSNEHIKSITKFASIFTTCIAEEVVGGCQRGFYYRPMQYVFYFITSRFSQDPWIFHLANLLYFWVCGILVYEFVKLIWATRSFKWLPFVAASIFITNPVNSEVVNWVSATPEFLMVIFTLSYLILYLRYLKKPKKIYLFLSCVFLFLAILSKETAVFLILALPAAYFLFAKSKRYKVYEFFYFLIPLFIYFVLRTAVLGRVVYKYEGYYALNLVSQIYTALALFPKYLIKLVYPLPLSFQPLIEPATAINFQVILGVLLTLGTFVLWLLILKKQKLLVFALFLIIVGILPVLVFANKLGQFIFSERYLFFSTVGFAIVVGEAVNVVLVRKSRFWTWVIVGFGAFYLVFSWFVVVRRNLDWKDNKASYLAMIRVNPQNSNAHFQLGRIYEDMGQFDLAISEIKQAGDIDQNNKDAKEELGFLENVYSFRDLYSFHYPMGWKVSEEKNRVIVSRAEINVEISGDNKKSLQTADEYLSGQKEVSTIVNQGLAQIPNSDVAYVRIYSGSKGQDFEFFVFKGSRVIRIYLTGVKSQADMNEFNRILGSISFSH